MQVVVISPEKPDPREPAVLAELLDAGLQRYHVRKPGWSALELEQWILFLPEWFRRHLIIHHHHALVEKLGLGGRHFPAGGARQPADAVSDRSLPGAFTSRSCHDLDSLRDALGRYDSVFFGPVFPSISKPGRLPAADIAAADVDSLLKNRAGTARATDVIALGGVTPANAAECGSRGFDGVALLGSVWQAPDPVRAYLRVRAAADPAESVARGRRQLPPVMCLTQDGLSLSHVEQARLLCRAGARCIQLRMKDADSAAWLASAREVVAVCREAGVTCIVNDSVDIALAAGADGVHLGRGDGEWAEARARVGARRIVGGTVNNEDDARRAREAGCLDYVGIGPLRFTSTKAKLAPVLGPEGIQKLIPVLGGLPAWVIGGVRPADAPVLRRIGAAGVAVSSSLYRGDVAANFQEFSKSSET